MIITIANITPWVAIIAGILILIMPRLLNYIVAHLSHHHRPHRPQRHPPLHQVIRNLASTRTFGLASQSGAVIISAPGAIKIRGSMVKSTSRRPQSKQKPARKAPKPQGCGARQARCEPRPRRPKHRRARKWVYIFGDGKAEGTRRHAQPARRQGRRTSPRWPVSACRCRPASPSPPRSARYYYANGRNLPDGPRRRRSTQALAHVGTHHRQGVRRRATIRCSSRCAPARAPRCRA